jgi:hypothetical protein
MGKELPESSRWRVQLGRIVKEWDGIVHCRVFGQP